MILEEEVYESQSYELCNFLHLCYQSEQANWFSHGNGMSHDWPFHNFYLLTKDIGVEIIF